jgi:hypothetical protein
MDAVARMSALVLLGAIAGLRAEEAAALPKEGMHEVTAKVMRVQEGNAVRGRVVDSQGKIYDLPWFEGTKPALVSGKTYTLTFFSHRWYNEREKRWDEWDRLMKLAQKDVVLWPEPGPQEQWHVVTAKVERVEQGGVPRLRVVDPPDKIYEMDWPENSKLPVVPGRVYTMTILTDHFFSPDGALFLGDAAVRWIPRQRLMKLVQDDMILWDASLCEVHGAKMQRKDLPIDYGEALSQPWRMAFPHGDLRVNGGCIKVEGRSPQMRKGFVCPQCVAGMREKEAQLAKATR